MGTSFTREYPSVLRCLPVQRNNTTNLHCFAMDPEWWSPCLFERFSYKPSNTTREYPIDSFFSPIAKTLYFRSPILSLAYNTYMKQKSYMPTLKRYHYFSSYLCDSLIRILRIMCLCLTHNGQCWQISGYRMFRWRCSPQLKAQMVRPTGWRRNSLWKTTRRWQKKVTSGHSVVYATKWGGFIAICFFSHGFQDFYRRNAILTL